MCQGVLVTETRSQLLLFQVLNELREFLPTASSAMNFEYSHPGFVINPQTGKLNNDLYRILRFIMNVRMYRDICGAISNCCQCVSNLQSDAYKSTNAVPLIQFLAYDDGDGLRDMYAFLKEPDVDYGRKSTDVLDAMSMDMMSILEGSRQIIRECARKMRARVIEVMYTALHPHGPVIPSPATHTILTVLKAGESVFQTFY